MRYNISEITELIKDRRTITPEFYSDRVVHREIVENVLNAAIWAPTHGKTQPWRFKVFMEEGRQKLADFLGKTYLELTPPEMQNDMKLAKMMTRTMKSSVVIAIVMERQLTEKIPEIEEVEAVACAVQNMHLALTAYGIGGFWATPKLIYHPKMNDFLQIGEKDKCLGLFYMGYTREEWPKGQRKPIEYVTEWING